MRSNCCPWSQLRFDQFERSIVRGLREWVGAKSVGTGVIDPVTRAFVPDSATFEIAWNHYRLAPKVRSGEEARGFCGTWFHLRCDRLEQISEGLAIREVAQVSDRAHFTFVEVIGIGRLKPLKRLKRSPSFAYHLAKARC